MRNVIGIDPAFYEYIFMVDADMVCAFDVCLDLATLQTVTPESLDRLVISSANDPWIVGICGEAKLQNKGGSWWTMVQVYE